MKQNVLKYGLIIGAILCAIMIVLVNMAYNNPEFRGNEVVGYATMILVFSMMYLGIRNYRDNYLDGYISFGNAFKTGFLIALVASTMYVVVWLIYYYLFVPDFMEVYTAHMLNNTPEDELEAAKSQMDSFKEMYKNPLLVILLTYSEVLPIGLIISLIMALILKRKPEQGS